MKPNEQRRTEYMPLAAVKPAVKNPKNHDLGAIAESFERNGFGEAPLLDERTGRLVAGHGRLLTLAFLQKQGKEPPAGIRAERGEWMVPVQRGWASKNDEDAAAYLLGSNRLSELGGWEEAERDAMLVELSKLGEDALKGTGYDADDVDRILREALPADADEIPPIPATSWVKRGDLFRLGDHRLLCGDATSPVDVGRLMGKERAGLMNTDPPYGVAYDSSTNPTPPKVLASRIANDDLSDKDLETFLHAAFALGVDALAPNAAWYVWHAALRSDVFLSALRSVGVKAKRHIIWVKSQLTFGRGQYHWMHEPAWFGWGAKQPPDFGRGDGERDQTTVWDGIKNVTTAERKDLAGHATPKPVALFEIPLIKHLKVDEIAYEPFAGTGPQFIAAEHLNRRCFGMDLEPRYVQTILARWEKFTGRKAEQVK